MLAGKHRLRIAIAIAVMLLATIAETFGIAAILPALILASDSSGSNAGGISEKINKFFDHLGWHPPLVLLLSIVVAGIGAKGALGLLGQQLIARGVTQVAADFRRDLIQALMASRWNYMIVQPAGAIANAISAEAIRASGLFSSTVMLIVAVLSTIPFVLLALSLSWQFTLICAGVCLFLISILYWTVLQTRRHSRELTRSSRALVTRLVDSIVSLKPLKAMALQDRIWPFLETEVNKLAIAERRQRFSKSLQTAIQEPTVAVIICVGMYVAFVRLHLGVAEIGFMLVLFQRLITRLMAVQNQLQLLAVSETAFLHLTSEIAAASLAAEVPPSAASTPEPRHDVRLRKRIEVHCVSLSYPQREVFRDLNLSLTAGKMIAIVGPSGAGKTTLADLITGMQWPQSGSILIDGIPLGQIDIQTWRQHIGYVPQELQLLNDTILANLTLMDEKIEKSAVTKALERAGATDFVNALPLGLDTLVGERGAVLSGGQRQRLAIARALVRSPDLLILDESTTALDPRTEYEICQSLRNMAGEITILAISHQSAIADIADVVIRVEDGKATVLEAGAARSKHLPVA